jgi:putative endonuclease
VTNLRKFTNREIGQWGEAFAERFLSERGYLIVERNFRTPDGEIDIIAMKEGELVFVEVKTRRNTRHSFPEEAVNEEKIDHLDSAVGWYLQKHPESEENWHLDVISIVGTPDSIHPQIMWFRDVTG